MIRIETSITRDVNKAPVRRPCAKFLEFTNHRFTVTKQDDERMSTDVIGPQS